jgi:hypothetical protein
MNKEFIPFEQALELKELGFDAPCMFPYHRNNTNYIDSTHVELANYNATEKLVSAVLYQQAFRWFRENYNLLGGVYSNASGWLWEIHDNIGGTHRFGCDYEGDCEHSGTYTSFDKAELACLKKLIEMVKGKEVPTKCNTFN